MFTITPLLLLELVVDMLDIPVRFESGLRTLLFRALLLANGLLVVVTAKVEFAGMTGQPLSVS